MVVILKSEIYEEKCCRERRDILGSSSTHFVMLAAVRLYIMCWFCNAMVGPSYSKGPHSFTLR
jgi:hypothetical protein